jgi:hypothetical protein
MHSSIASLLTTFGHEVEDYIDKMADHDLAVGNGIPVNFDDWLVRKHLINPEGRMTRDGGVREYHAAPSTFDRKVDVKTTVDDHTADVLRFASGKSYAFDRKRDPPESEFVYRQGGVPHKYECKLLEALNEKYQHITLVNPSPGTLWRCQYLTFSIMLTDHTPAYFVQLQEVYASPRWSGPQEMRRCSDVKGVAYLGSNGIRDTVLPRVKTSQWVALCPNPFQTNFPYDEFMTWKPAEKEGDVYMTYTRNEHRMTAVLPLEPDFVVYNPAQVDMAYRKSGKVHASTKGTDKRYYLFTNLEDLGLPDVDQPEGDPVARVPEFPEYDINGFSYDDKFLYDVRGPGTYLSRRTSTLMRSTSRLLRLPIIPLTKNGARVITFSALEPFLGPYASEYSYRQSWIVSLQDNYEIVDRQLDCQTNGIVYSRCINSGIKINPFFEGSYIKVPFDRHKKEFQFIPSIPGTYFFFPNIECMYAYQLSVLHHLYGVNFKPKRMPYVPLDYSVHDRSSFIHGVLHSLGPAPLYAGGINLNELGRLAYTTLPFLKTSLAKYDFAVVYGMGDHDTHAMATSNVTDMFHMVDGMKTFEEIWHDWNTSIPLNPATDDEMEKIQKIFCRLGRPPLRSCIDGQNYVMTPPVVRDFSTRVKRFVDCEYVDSGCREGMV